MFNSTGPHHGPKCPAEYSRKRPNNRIDKPLELHESNYSGTGVDIAYCCRCEGYFEISYKVDKISPIDC
jgi:hypothetical protein